MSPASIAFAIGCVCVSIAIWIGIVVARSSRRRNELEIGAAARDALTAFADRALSLESTQQILQHARAAAWRLFGCERMISIEPGSERGTWEAMVTDGDELGGVPVHLRGLFAWFVHNSSVAWRGELDDARFGAMRAPLQELMDRYQVDVLVPLVEHGRLLAVVGLDFNRKLSRLDADVLKLFRLEVTAAVANIKLHRQAAHALSLAREIDLTSAVKLALVPDDLDGSSGILSWSGHYEAAGQAGSDFWAVYPLGDGRSLFVIGDAVGGGLAGSMVAAVVKACSDSALDSHGRQLGPAELLAALNAAIYQPASPAHTRCFAALFDPGSRRVLYANAGHSTPYRMTFADDATHVGVLAGSGEILGDSAVADYRENRSPLAKREAFLFFTDGLVKMQDRQGQPFGERRLQRILAAQRDVSPHELRDNVLTALTAFRDGAPLVDDIVILAVRSQLG